MADGSTQKTAGMADGSTQKIAGMVMGILDLPGITKKTGHNHGTTGPGMADGSTKKTARMADGSTQKVARMADGQGEKPQWSNVGGQVRRESATLNAQSAP